MKKIYLLLLVTVLAFAGSPKSAFGQLPPGFCGINTFNVLDPTDAIYPYGIVTGSGQSNNFDANFNSVFSGDLFYEGSFLYNYESQDTTIFLFDLLPGNYVFIYCGGQLTYPFTVNPIACDISLLNIGTTDVSGAGCTPNGVVDLTATSSTVGATYYYNLTELSTFVEYTGQDDGFGIISITGLSAGNYALFISTEPDVLNSTCNYNQLVTINEPSCDMAIPTFGGSNATSQGASDGALTVSVTGGSCIPTAPGGNPIYNIYAELNGNYYADLVFNSNNGNYELSGLMAGTYTVVAENGGTTCFASQDIIVGENGGCNLASPTINATNTTICNGSPATLSLDAGAYDSYQWIFEGSSLMPTGPGGTNNSYSAYWGGNYSCIVTLNGCTAVSDEVLVSLSLLPPAPPFGGDLYSCGPSLIVTYPVAAASYLWSTNETSNSINVTTDGWYAVGVIYDGFACGLVDTFYVSLNNVAPIADITVVGANPFCIGTTIDLQSASSTDNTWSTGQTDATITISSGGNYTLEVVNAIGCTATASVTVATQICVPPTQLANGACGNLNYVKTSAIACVLVPNATQYEWEFSNANGVYATMLSPLNYIALHNVTPTLNWGTTWSLRVRAIIGSNAGVFSSPCTIGIIADPAISGIPVTQLRTQDCGKLNYRINANNRIITLPVSGAVQYEFEFSNVTTGAVIATALRQYNVLFFNTVTPSLPFPAQYNVKTRARIGTTWGAFGPACIIGIIGLNRDGAEANQELAYDADGNVIVDAPYFDLSAMPNPYSDITSIVINSSINENVYVQFFDMTGKLVEDIKVTTNERFNVGANLSKGIYLLKAHSDSGNQVTTRLIKTN